MDRLDGTEIWRTIPPEEKIEVMNRAHSKGIIAVGITTIVCCTIAVGLKMSWVMWGSFLAAPFIFQFAAGKAWRDYRPRLVLEYLAARSAARRYAFSSKSKDLTCKLIFRGQFKIDNSGDAYAAALAALEGQETTAWITLFTDVLIVMTERLGGAKLEFASQLNSYLSVESNSQTSNSEYSNDKEVILVLHPKKEGEGEEKRYKITSQFPAALIVFEKQLKLELELAKKVPEALPEVPALEENDMTSDDMLFQ